MLACADWLHLQMFIDVKVKRENFRQLGPSPDASSSRDSAGTWPGLGRELHVGLPWRHGDSQGAHEQGVGSKGELETQHSNSAPSPPLVFLIDAKAQILACGQK